MAKIAEFMNEQNVGSIEQTITKSDGMPVMFTPAVAVPVTGKITAAVVAFTIPVGAYVTGRVVN
ncbi:hypothetical protein [Streptomyces flavofungini]|uniref:hypothetical protein n=1 Tax=Streptomyces flavofungini TaxID=68200 RepID=UPI0025B2234D|nr:hypothetical protein [Streptomyces flavofungini]WJV51689.1 hypothetical protein QUY26_40225 [Streptomyces flavofungini]